MDSVDLDNAKDVFGDKNTYQGRRDAVQELALHKKPSASATQPLESVNSLLSASLQNQKQKQLVLEKMVMKKQLDDSDDRDAQVQQNRQLAERDAELTLFSSRISRLLDAEDPVDPRDDHSRKEFFHKVEDSIRDLKYSNERQRKKICRLKRRVRETKNALDGWKKAYDGVCPKDAYLVDVSSPLHIEESKDLEALRGTPHYEEFKDLRKRELLLEKQLETILEVSLDSIDLDATDQVSSRCDLSVLREIRRIKNQTSQYLEQLCKDDDQQ